jgi:hypothetical protein
MQKDKPKTWQEDVLTKKIEQFDQLAHADGSILQYCLHLPHVLMRVAAYRAVVAH